MKPPTTREEAKAMVDALRAAGVIRDDDHHTWWFGHLPFVVPDQEDTKP